MVTAVFAVKRLLDRCEEQHRAAVAAFERVDGRVKLELAESGLAGAA
jgi:hypothetical protein